MNKLMNDKLDVNQHTIDYHLVNERQSIADRCGDTTYGERRRWFEHVRTK